MVTVGLVIINMLKKIMTKFIHKKLKSFKEPHVYMFEHRDNPIILMGIINVDYASDMFAITRDFPNIYHIDLEFHTCRDDNCWIV